MPTTNNNKGVQINKQNLSNATNNIIRKLEEKLTREEMKKLESALEFRDVTAFINYLKDIKARISSGGQIQETLKNNPEYSPIAPLFSQIELFIENFVKAIDNLIDMNKRYMIGWMSEKDKRINDWDRITQGIGNRQSLAIKGQQYKNAYSMATNAFSAMTRSDQQRFLRNYHLRGGSKHENLFIKHFKKTLQKLDKILENTKLSVSDKEKKLQKVMKTFKKDLDNQVIKFKKITEKSTKKSKRIIKRSIHKLKKLSKQPKKIVKKKPIQKKSLKKKK